MKKSLFPVVAVSVVAMLSACRAGEKDYTSFVDPYIGSGGHGHVFVGASVPFGMVQLGPQQIKDEWDWCSGYHYSDTLVIGFSHTHLSGTGIGDLGDILFMPFDPARTKYDSRWAKRKNADATHIYALLDHSKEVVHPGFYSLEMPDYGVKVRLTATERTGLHEYTFTEDSSAVLLDLCTGIGWDGVTSRNFTMLSPTRIEGYRHSSGWAKDHTIYFAAEFSAPICHSRNVRITDDEYAVALFFDTTVQKKVIIKVGLSPVSCENAWDNLNTEQSGWDFDALVRSAKDRWNKELGRLHVRPIDSRQQKIFYTSLYHTMILPSLFSDCNGDYRGADGRVHRSDTCQYTVLSLWDTYRAASPLMTIINPEMSASMSSTLINIYESQGKLPVWHLAGNETDCMVGNPGVIVMADLCLKGFVKDVPAALEAMKSSSMLNERGLELLNAYGYIPFDKSIEPESVSKAMEFSIADASVAKVARENGDAEAAAYFGKRSNAWKRHYDRKTGFVRGRAADGSWRTPFDPFMAVHMKSDFTEGNAWQYTFLVPQDVPGLIETMGGRSPFEAKLDEFFTVDGDLGPDANDVTGLIGQYAHGNEPSHHVAYLYDYIGRQDKCAEKVRYILENLYSDDYDGICGNEDAGQMSAWYVLSALGLYQVDPAGGEFRFGSPIVKKAVLKVGNGKTFTIIAHKNSPKNIYIKSARLNEEFLDRNFITYDEIVSGGVLEFYMGPDPVKDFSSAPKVPAEIEASENTEANLGTIYESDGLVSTVLVVRNEFSDTLVPVVAYTSCQCAEASVDVAPVAPGDNFRISVTYNPAYKSGIIMEEIRVKFLDFSKDVSLILKGDVIPCKHPVSEDHPYDFGKDLHLSHEVLHFGKIRAGESRDIFVRYANDSRKGINLDFVPCMELKDAIAARRGIELSPEGRDTLHFRFKMPDGMHEGDTLMYPIKIAVNGQVLNKALMVKAIALE